MGIKSAIRPEGTFIPESQSSQHVIIMRNDSCQSTFLVSRFRDRSPSSSIQQSEVRNWETWRTFSWRSLSFDLLRFEAMRRMLSRSLHWKRWRRKGSVLFKRREKDWWRARVLITERMSLKWTSLKSFQRAQKSKESCSSNSPQSSLTKERPTKWRTKMSKRPLCTKPPHS